MSRRLQLPAVIAVAAFIALCPAVVVADEGEDDHEVARELYEHGDIRSLGEVVATLKRDNRGEVVGIELIPIGNRWVYRFQVIAPDGHRSIIEVDAGFVSSSAQGGDD